MRKKSTRFLSAALAACMMASVLPVSAFADGGTGSETGGDPQQGEVIKEFPREGGIIEEGGTYNLYEDYTGCLDLRLGTGGSAVINVTGNVHSEVQDDQDAVLLLRTGKVTINNKEYDVMVKGDGASSVSLDALRSMPVSSAYGGTVPLSSVADVTVEQAAQSITRHNQTRQVTITGDTISGDSTAITKAINEILDQYTLPQGYTAQTAGAYEDMMDSFGDLGLALAVALLLVYFVLAVQFESFAMPVMVMLILPVAFTGALFALPLTGRDMSMIALVAIIMLAGTVVNSSIILVEYIKIRRGMGEDRETAILHACPLRIRPIMMTTLTTVLAMVPMALGLGESNEMMSDMGVTMISGMVISTIVTLVFTPVYYSVIDNLSHLGRGRKKKQKNVPAPAAQA